MNWLSRIQIHAEVARKEGILDNYAWHKRLWEDCFTPSPEAKRDFLSRIESLEGVFQVWILSRRKPHRPKWCPEEGYGIKKVAPSFLSHQYYAFDLRANPVKTIAREGPDGKSILRPNGKKISGKRIPLVKHDELRDWIERKGRVRCREQITGKDVPGGFQLVAEKPLEISPMVKNHFRKNSHAAYHGGVQFRGTLKVTDRERFIETYQSGVGPAKSFGFGLLLLAPVNI